MKKILVTILCGIVLVGMLSGCTEEEKDETTGETEEPETEVVYDAAVNYLGDEGLKTYITADSLFDLLNNSDATDDPYILSIRDADDYAVGHIPGAVNILGANVFTEENLANLPTDKQIVVVCYTGHTASQMTALLNLNGYDAVCLKFGMCSWTTNATITESKCYDSTSIIDNQIVEGADPGSWI